MTQTTTEVLQGIFERHGDLSPELVVEEAADQHHPLHARFEWDDTAAGHKYRLQQGAQLIRSAHVVIERGVQSEPVRVRAFIAERDTTHISTPDEEEPDDSTGHYLPVRDVVSDDVLRSAWFLSMERDWQRLKRKYAAHAEFAQLVLGDLRQESA